MKALSLTQPWASLMAIEAKRNETRSRSLAYLGDIAICSTKEVWRTRVPAYAEIALNRLWALRDKFPGYHANLLDLYLSLPFGKALCLVRKTGCVSTDDDNGDDRSLTPLEMDLGDYSAGRFYYPTTDCRRLKQPVPVSGLQGLFNLPPDVEKAILAQL